MPEGYGLNWIGQGILLKNSQSNIWYLMQLMPQNQIVPIVVEKINKYYSTEIF